MEVDQCASSHWENNKAMHYTQSHTTSYSVQRHAHSESDEVWNGRKCDVWSRHLLVYPSCKCIPLCVPPMLNTMIQNNVTANANESDFFFSPSSFYLKSVNEIRGNEQISTTTNFKVAEDAEKKIMNKDFWVKMFEANSTELSPPCTDLRNKVSR